MQRCAAQGIARGGGGSTASEARASGAEDSELVSATYLGALLVAVGSRVRVLAAAPPPSRCEEKRSAVEDENLRAPRGNRIHSLCSS